MPVFINKLETLNIASKKLLMDLFRQSDTQVTGESPAGGKSVSGCRCASGRPGPSPEAVR